MINFPTSLDSLTNPASDNTLDSPSHSGQHSDVNDAVEALEAKVGANSSAVTTSHDYKLSGVTGTDKAVSKTGTEVLTNKTLTSPVLTSPVLTTPQINDTSANHQYIVGVSELTADRTVTLPLLTGNDEFVFKDHTQTLTNKTLTSPVINTGLSGTAKATGAEVTTGTEDGKFVTPKAIGDAGVNTRLKSKAVTISRDMTSDSGDVSTTGVGFQPSAIQVIAMCGGPSMSIGFSDSSRQEYCMIYDYSRNAYALSNVLLKVESAGGQAQQCYVKSFDSDGFTLTWTKTNSPTGTLTVQVLCFR